MTIVALKNKQVSIMILSLRVLEENIRFQTEQTVNRKKNQDSVPPHMSFVKHFFTSSMLRYIMAQWKGPDPKARP